MGYSRDIIYTFKELVLYHEVELSTKLFEWGRV